MKTPASLLERIRETSAPDAWERFVELYSPLLFHWARRTGLQPQDAADLVQDVFVVLVRKLPEFTYDQHRSFCAWLRTVTLNKWRERLRLPTTGVDLSAVAEPTAPGDEPWEIVSRRQLARRALEIMRTDFQPTTWRACYETVVLGRSAAEVAAELGLTSGAVHAARFRVLSRLREELKGLMD